jgi:hypothetical protein
MGINSTAASGLAFWPALAASMNNTVKQQARQGEAARSTGHRPATPAPLFPSIRLCYRQLTEGGFRASAEPDKRWSNPEERTESPGPKAEENWCY